MYVEGEIPSVTTGNAGSSFVYPVMPYGYGMGGFGGGFGGDAIWLIVLLALFGGWGNNSWGGNGFGGNNMLYDINANTNRGFDNLALNSGIDNLQTAVTTGFANAEVGRCNSTTSLLQAINGVQAAQQQCLTKDKKPKKFFATNKFAVGTCA